MLAFVQGGVLRLGVGVVMSIVVQIMGLRLYEWQGRVCIVMFAS